MSNTEPIFRRMKPNSRNRARIAKLIVVADRACILKLYIGEYDPNIVRACDDEDKKVPTPKEYMGKAICEKQEVHELWRLQNWDINTIVDERKGG